MADDLSLLFRLRADNAQAKATIADTRAAVGQLRQSFGPQLTQTVSVANKTFSDLGNNLNLFIGERLPLVGGAFVRITENLKHFSSESGKSEKAIGAVAKSIQSIATESGKGVPQITSFLTKFVQIEGQANRDKAAVEFFGASLGSKLVPELEETGTALAGVSEESATTGASIAAMAGPIGIAVLAIGALVAGAALAVEQLFELSKGAAEFQGRMFDLAQQTGLAVETLSALEVVAKTTGGNLDSIAQAVVLFQRKLDEAQDPLSKTAEQFRKFNIATTDTENSLRQTFAALAAMPEGFAQTNAAAEFFGARGGKQVLAILKETHGNIDKTIEELRELGILITEEDARSAKQFNDTLALLNFQMRALGAVAAEELIPAFIEIIRSVGELVHALRPLIALFGEISGFAVRRAGDALKGLSVIVQILTRDYEGLARAIKEAREAQEIAPIQVPSTFLTPTALPGQQSPQQQASEAINQAEEILAAVKRNAAQSNEALNELFQQGRHNRQQETEGIIAENKKVLDAEQNRIDKLIEQKQLEIKSLDDASRNRGEAVNRDAEQYRAATTTLTKLFQERLDKENEFNVQSKSLRAKAAKEQADADRDQAQSNTDALAKELDRQILLVDEAAKRRAAIEPLTFGDLGAQLEEERRDLQVIQALEKAKLDARQKGLEEQIRIGNLTVDEQRQLNNQIRQLLQDGERLESEHIEQRVQIALEGARRLAAIAQISIDQEKARSETVLQVGQINDQARIASIQALAELRVKTEEQAAREILDVRLKAIDREREATEVEVSAVRARNNAEIEALRNRQRAIESELQKTGAIKDPTLRLKAQESLTKEQAALTDAEIALIKKANAETEKAENDRNNKVRILNAERSAIQQQGDHDIDEGRKKDIENEQHYLQALTSLEQQAADARREIARTVIDLMVLNFARRKEIIKAQAQADVDEENRRHKQAENEIRSLRHDIAESNRTKEEKLAALLEIDELEETEAERHRLAIEEIRRRARQDEKNADPIGRIKINLDDLKEFARVIEDSIIPLGQILTNTFQQVADAIGQTVENWVLLGDTGPAVMRKILAQALASIAAEAAVNAIKELALGFATLFFNPAESAAHFTAAALWGSIGGVAAIAGRSVAGDLFKQKTSGGAGGSSAGGNNGSSQINPVSLARNPGTAPQRVIVEIRANGEEMKMFSVNAVDEDFRKGGKLRETFNKDGGV